MKNKFDQLCEKVISTFLQKKKKEENIQLPIAEENEVENEIMIDVDWSDINAGVSESPDNSIISRALRKNGYYAIVNESTITLDNGVCYFPENLTDHWELFYGSRKAKPAKISYHQIV